MKTCLRLLLILLLYAPTLSAQTGSPVRLSHHLVDTLSFSIDTLSIVPGSFHPIGLDPDSYTLDPISATLKLKDSTLLGKVISYEYQTYSMDFSKPLSHKSIQLLEQATPYVVTNPEYPALSLEKEEDRTRMVSSGSISRGVSVGNSQDLVLNSSLNLQLYGNLTENLQLQAVISDKNIPIQPEGNTQNIQNINNVYIKLLYKDRATVSAGDIALPAPKSQFLFATGDLLGMDGSVTSMFKDNMVLTNRLGGGVAKGRFVQQTIQPQSGVQGPYKLMGEYGELGIVIIAGSERVYVDGKLLVRGQDQDYTIDYNTAELTFTPAMLMAPEKRVVVEFEYADRHYARYDLYSYNDFQINRHHLHVNFYQSQDLKNQSLQPELSDAHKLFLSQMGDQDAAAYHIFETVPFAQDRVQYERRDTLVNGQPYTGIYVYTTDPSATVYAPTFTYVGANKGSYRLQSSTTNGRVFVWVAPENGHLQGDYEAAVQLTTPKMAQMLTIASESQLTKRFSFSNELALSHYDQNLFSKLDDKDNVGFAYHACAKHVQPLQRLRDDTATWRLQSEIEWQFVHRNFHAIERFREVEFARDYNLTNQDSVPRSEQMLHALISVQKPGVSTTSYSLNWFSRLKEMYALRHVLFSRQQWKGFLFDTKTSFLHSNDALQRTRYWTSSNQLSYSFKPIEIGVRHLLEHNLFQDALTDTLRSNSFSFNEFEIYFKNSAQQTKYHYLLAYKNRVEWSPDTSGLRQHLAIHEARTSFGIHHWRNHQLSIQGTYRNQRLVESMNAAEHYFVGSAEYTGRIWKKAIVLQTYYEVGSGMEQQKVFTFLKVAPGQGTHVWNDYNGNGIEELEEFEVAAFQYEADYVKVFLASNDYINTFNNQLTQSVQFRPANLWSQPLGFRKFLSRFSDVMMIRSQMKNLLPNMNPFHRNMEDTNVVNRNMVLNNTLSFNNSSSKFAFDFIVQESQQKNLLYYGFERSNVSLQHVVLKSAPVRFLRLQVGYLHQETVNQSESMTSRCYQILHHQTESRVMFQHRNILTLTADYIWMWKHEAKTESMMRAHKASLTADVRMAKYGVLTGSVQYVLMGGSVPANSSISYVMLEGLSIGQNALWELRYQLSLNNYLQLAFYYEGRYSQGHRVVHTGNVTVKAQF
ncbi:MAG: hypothetical protein IKU03_03300 [Bacteroidales bacterium]|nr:hypothetical protein [Bacteroidales bacterium]